MNVDDIRLYSLTLDEMPLYLESTITGLLSRSMFRMFNSFYIKLCHCVRYYLIIISIY